MEIKILLSLALCFSLSCLKSTSAESEHQWAPTYHFAPEKGWMNDPNGLSYYDDYYHAFYQHNPYDTRTGLMHWGHVRSKDMLSWERLPIALTPSLPEDINGIFSGSAVINNDNLTLIYTGINGAHQAQCLATSSDGVSFSKEGMVLQKDGDDQNFRDPKVWWLNGSWFVIIGSASDNRGEVLLYKSPDLFSWESQGALARADEKLGYMWECPDFFTLEDKQILVINPQGIQQDVYDYQNLYQTGYFIGIWTPGSEYQIEKGFREIDHGHDFYASQTFLAPDGRRILIAWMGMWDSVFPEAVMGWAGMLTLPRELTLSSSGNLEMRPIREIQDWRTGGPTIKKSAMLVNCNTTYLEEGVFSKEIIIDFDLPQSTAEKFGITLGSSDYSDKGIQVYVNQTEGRLFLERYYPLYNIAASSRSVPVNLNETLSLDIFVDGSSIEVFVNDGQAVLSSRIYPNDDQRILSFFLTDGKFIVSRYVSWNLAKPVSKNEF